MKSFSERLRAVREKAGLSQDSLAEKLGIKSGKQTISRWERGATEPAIAQLLEIATALGVSAAYLLGESAVEQPIPDNKMLIDKDEYINLLRQDNQRKKDEIDRLSGPGGNASTLTATSSYVVQLY